MKYELMSPVGSFTALHAAIEAGADSIYFGIKGFNMREGAKNFQLKDINKIQKICSKSNVKTYLTLNTILYSNELKKVETILKKIKGKINAVICWDLGIIQLCKKHKIPFHISTQTSISNIESAKFYEKLGAKKIVLARELSLKQIKEISKKVKIDVECFCHGAMCVSVSGRCFTSQFLFGKSANRGQCLHPCRRAYKVSELNHPENELILQNNRVMSAKDLCTLPFIEKMKNSGIKTFKIEGRNRSPEYVYNVTKAYRKALDNKLSQEQIKNLINELKKVYNRGFSTGFYFKTPTNDDFSASENGEQTEKKQYVGRIEKHWPKPNSYSLKVHANTISQGDEVYIQGSDSGLTKTKVQSMEFKEKQIKIAKKGGEVGIKFTSKKILKRGDEVYLIKKK
jgi:putative protease